jgi:hypothetical protein
MPGSGHVPVFPKMKNSDFAAALITPEFPFAFRFDTLPVVGFEVSPKRMGALRKFVRSIGHSTRGAAIVRLVASAFHGFVSE